MGGGGGGGGYSILTGSIFIVFSICTETYTLLYE